MGHCSGTSQSLIICNHSSVRSHLSGALGCDSAVSQDPLVKGPICEEELSGIASLREVVGGRAIESGRDYFSFFFFSHGQLAGKKTSIAVRSDGEGGTKRVLHFLSVVVSLSFTSHMEFCQWSEGKKWVGCGYVCVVGGANSKVL